MNIPKKAIVHALDFYGIKRNVRGYAYLSEAIRYIMNLPENEWYNVKMTNEVYPYVGSLYGYSGWAHIARNITYAIRSSAKYGTELLPPGMTARGLILTIITDLATIA